jgi:hypothetical protein
VILLLLWKVKNIPWKAIILKSLKFSRNYIEIVNIVVRYAFLMLYSDNDYIDNLHKYYLNTIKSTYTVEGDYVITDSQNSLEIKSNLFHVISWVFSLF